MIYTARRTRNQAEPSQEPGPYTRVFTAFGGARALGTRSTPAPEPSGTKRNQARNQALYMRIYSIWEGHHALEITLHVGICSIW